MYPAEADPNWTEGKMKVKIAGILKPKEDTNFGCLRRGVYYTKAMTKRMIADSVNSEIVANSTYGIEKHIQDYLTNFGDDMESYKAYVTFKYTSWMDSDNPVIVDDGIAMALNTDLSASISSLISITGSSSLEADKLYLRSLSGLATKGIANASGATAAYEFRQLPKQISVYLTDFNQKERLLSYLDSWNQEGNITIFAGTPNEKVLTLNDRAELTYTDTIGMIITVVNTLINAITIALIIFVSLALVVSCFMIAVITYISTMERVKEIGVIRSLGGRKLDVSRLFIAECLITGFASGIIGVLLTYVLDLVINLIVSPFGVRNIAILAPLAALIMIIISVVLNVLSGLIPSMRASNQDPVKALRNE